MHDLVQLPIHLISIHALLAESDRVELRVVRGGNAISIHALLAESDSMTCKSLTVCQKFLSTLSLRRATVELVIRGDNRNISIHALLAESDRHGHPSASKSDNI